MSRQLWDEARHAMMGEVGFVAQGIDWRTIPINFTWSRNLNTQISPLDRHAVLYFIEQGLMPKTGKRFEYEVAKESGDPLAQLFQDYDWADEVLHSAIGRQWLVKAVGGTKKNDRIRRQKLGEDRQRLAQVPRRRLNRAPQLVAGHLSAGVQTLGHRPEPRGACV